MNSHTPEQPASNSPAAPPGVVCSEFVRRNVLERTLAALEAAADDAMSYGPSEADADYLSAIAEAKAELNAPNK